MEAARSERLAASGSMPLCEKGGSPLLAENVIRTSAKKKRRSYKAIKKFIPFAYLSPTILLLTVLSLIPIGMVIYYSLMDNVIMNPNPAFVGLANYAEILTDNVFRQALSNTMYFTVMSVVMHLVLGLGFAMLLNTKVISPLTRALFRVIYILPWVF